MRWRIPLIILLAIITGLLVIHPNRLQSKPQVPSGVEELEKALVEIAKRVEPSVVNISAEKTEKVSVPSPFEEFENDPFFRRFFREFQFPSFPREQVFRRRTLGSGFIVSANGYVLTNAHVVEGFDEVTVITHSGASYKGRVVGRDDRSDLALVKIENPGEPLQPVVLGTSSNLQVGQIVAAFGNPFGVGQSMTLGVISALNRSQVVEEKSYLNLIQTDAALNPGNSGGPLVNIKGEVIGINVAIASPGAFNVGVGFAIPIDIAKKLLPQLEKGKVTRGYLGVRIQSATPDMKAIYGAGEGALVVEVVPNSPADKAGIKEGDIIIRVDNKPIHTDADLVETIAFTSPGTRVTLTVIRDKKEMRIPVTIGSAEESLEASVSSEKEGIRVENITPQLRERYRISSGLEGVVVTRVGVESPFYSAGIREGDVIYRINDEKVRNVSEFNNAISKAKKIGRAYIWFRRGFSNYVVTVYF
ncbi:Do family serine endopeptidase [bacterium]|nr:Do family serine endopeptidase [bacterium]